MREAEQVDDRFPHNGSNLEQSGLRLKSRYYLYSHVHVHF